MVRVDFMEKKIIYHEKGDEVKAFVGIFNSGCESEQR
jgi:hypothetical protein